MQKKASEGENAVKGALILALSAIIVKFLGLIYKVPLSYVLSDEGMGYFNSAYTVYTFFYLVCTSGVPKAISILTSEAKSNGDDNSVNLIFRTAFILFFGFGIFMSILFFAIAKPLSAAIGSSGSYYTMLAISPSILFVCASGVLRGYYNGVLDFLPMAISEIISGISKLVFGLLFAFCGYKIKNDLTVISAMTIAGVTIGAFLGYIYLLLYKKAKYPPINSRQKCVYNISKKVVIKIFKIAVPLTLTSVIGSISGIIDMSIIMKRLSSAGYSELQANILYGNYTTLALPMLNLITVFTSPASAVLLPIVSKSNVKYDTALLSQRITATVKSLSFLIFPITVFFFFNSYDILSIVFDNSSAVLAAPLLTALAPGMIFMCFLTVINTSLEGMGSNKVPLLSLVIGSAFKIGISALLLQSDSYGMLGAPIGNTFSYLISFLISVTYLTVIKKIKIKFINITVPIAVSTVISFTVSNFITNMACVKNIFGIILKSIIFTAVYGIFLLSFRFFAYKKDLHSSKSTNIC